MEKEQVNKETRSIIENIKKISDSKIEAFAVVQSWNQVLTEFEDQASRHAEDGKQLSRNYHRLLQYFNSQLGASADLIQNLEDFYRKTDNERRSSRIVLNHVLDTLEACLKNDLKTEAEQECKKNKETLDVAILRVNAKKLVKMKTQSSAAQGSASTNNLAQNFEMVAAKLEQEVKRLNLDAKVAKIKEFHAKKLIEELKKLEEERIIARQALQKKATEEFKKLLQGGDSSPMHVEVGLTVIKPS